MSSNFNLSQPMHDNHIKDLSFHLRSYLDNDGRATHAHEETHLIFVIQGRVEERRLRQTFVRTPDTLFLLPSGEPHSTHFCGGVTTFEIAMTSAWAERLRPYSSLVERPSTIQGGRPIWLARRLYDEYRHRDDLTALMLEGLLLELLAQMARDASETASSVIPRRMALARDFVHAHFTESLTVAQVAAAAGVHPAHLTRSFRQQLGCTLGDYIRRLRIEFASHLLLTSATPLSQVALETGFSDQSHFTRTFKSITGMTPTEFQKTPSRAALKPRTIL
jgi:AraC family transcriptional regulator